MLIISIKYKKKNQKIHIINCILLVLLLLVHKISSTDIFPKHDPIVSSISTFNYNLARFLCDLPSLVVPDDYSDTFSFVSQIKNTNLSGKFLVSYDVNSLFNNILLQVTIDIAMNLIFRS